ncbi:MAG: signal recognition particle protein [Candidatus Arsenophonus melophagi]|nr:signal recognition particle protein [Candidatus Arsenophonus melophagi]
MFDNLTNRLSRALRNIRGQGRLTEDNIKETLREVRMALLEADVALPVVRNFIQSVKERSEGQEVNTSLTPGQVFVKIVQNELTQVMMDDENSSLNLTIQPPAVILIVGLQGSGKTTTVAKLGKILKEKQKKKILVASADIYRPAAIKQLETFSKIVGIDFFPSADSENPINIATNALQHAKLKFYDVLIIDTAGCLHIDTDMMKEIQAIYYAINPIETLFIVDAMTGQDAANTAKSFNEILILTGIILTKIDGDTRGGAALSMRYITGKPIKFLGTGEKIDRLEPFYPDRIAARILGMGDVLSLIEEIESNLDHKKAAKLAHKLQAGNSFDLNDFREHLKQIRKIGGIGSILSKIPSIFAVSNTVKSKMDDKVLIGMEAIISSMTTKERKNPEIIKGSRKRRIAAGSGKKVQDVNQLLKEFDNIKRLMNQIKKHGLSHFMRGMKGIMPIKFPGT